MQNIKKNTILKLLNTHYIEIFSTIIWWFWCFYNFSTYISTNFFIVFFLPPLFIWSVAHIRRQTKKQESNEKILQEKLSLLAYPNIIAQSIENGINQALTSQIKDLQNITKDTLTNLSPLLNQLESQTKIFEKIKNTNTNLAHEINNSVVQIDSSLNEFLKKYTIIQNNSDQHLAELKTIWTEIVEQSEGIHSMLRIQNNESTEFCNQLHQLTQNMQNEYKKQTESFHKTLNEASTQLTNRESSFNQHIQLIEQETKRIIDNMNDMGKKYNQLIDDRIINTKEDLSRHVHDMASLSNQLIKKVQESTSIFDIQKDKFSILGKDFLISFEKEINDILSYAESQSTKMTEILSKNNHINLTTIEKMHLICADTSQAIEKDTANIYSTLKKESDLLESFIAQFKNQAQNIHHAFSDQINILSKATVETERQSDIILKTIARQSEILYANSIQSIENFNKVASVMENKSSIITKNINDSNALFNLVTNNFFDQSEKITQKSLHITQNFQENSQILSSYGKTLFEYAEKAKNIHENNISLIEKNIEFMQIQTEQASQQTENIVQNLQNYGNAISVNSNQAHQSIIQVGDTLTRKYNLLKETSSTIQQIFRTMSDQLTQKTHHFVKEFQNASQIAEQATKIFNTQITELIQQSKKAYSEASQLQIQQEKFHRGFFMKAARFITEDLHAISIDLTRILDTKISESDWKRYIKGDRGIFTRTLIQSRYNKLSQTLVQEIRNNHELRMYVIKYIELFDTIIKDSQKVDPEWLLFSTFTTSDVGKLYMMLCKVVGHTPPIKDDSEIKN